MTHDPYLEPPDYARRHFRAFRIVGAIDAALAALLFVVVVAALTLSFGFFASVAFADGFDSKNDPHKVEAVAATEGNTQPADVGHKASSDLMAPDFAADAGPAAAAPPAIDADPISFGKQLLDGVKSGRWLFAAGGVLMLLVWLARKILPSVGSLKGAALTLFTGILSFAGAAGTALWAGGKIDLALLATSAGVALVAMGGWAGVKNVGAWALGKLFKKS